MVGAGGGAVGGGGLVGGADMRRRPILVYVAGPYSHGSQLLHVRAAILAGMQIQQTGHAAYVPHYGHFADLVLPHAYEWWMMTDLGALACCDWLVRLPGHSPGADREQERAQVLGMPIFLSLEACLAALGQEVWDAGV